MYIHNLDPVLFDFGLIEIRWYSLSYVFGIIIGWWYGKKIILGLFKKNVQTFKIELFDDLITYLIISIIVGGRIGYVLFYNIEFYLSNPLSILKIWEGGMSFHGALLGVIIATHLFAKKNKISTFFLLDIIACVSPIGIFFGRISNFVNAELVGKVSSIPWGVVFPNIDMIPRHPSQIYESILEGLFLFLILNSIIFFKKDYKIGTCSSYFLIFYGVFRMVSEYFREPDLHIGYIYKSLSLGSILSFFMIIIGLIVFNYSKKNEA